MRNPYSQAVQGTYVFKSPGTARTIRTGDGHKRKYVLRQEHKPPSVERVVRQCKQYHSMGYTEISPDTWGAIVGFQVNIESKVVRLIKYSAKDW